MLKKYKKVGKKLTWAQTMPEALFGPIFIVLPSPASSSIDHVPILLLPMLVCWSRLLPAVVEGDE